MKKLIPFICLLAADTGGGTGAGVLDAEFKSTLLSGLGEIKKSQAETKQQITDIDAAFKLIKDENEQIKLSQDEIGRRVLAFQQERLNTLSLRRHKAGELAEDNARYIGALVCLDGLQGNKFLDARSRDFAEGLFKAITGINAKAALTSSDIPLPTGYSGDVVELVYMYGQARQWGTVFPLPNGSFKLPKLSTDPAFALIAGSGTVTETSPQTAWVTFNAEKFGGMVRLPTELDEDSIVAIGQFVARYAARQIAYVEDWNFFRGTGAASGVNGTAEGLTKSVVTDTMFYYNGGASNSGKTKQSDATLADFRTLRTVPSGAVLGQAAYYVHPTYEQLFCSFNTSATVTPYIANGANGATLDGFPIRWTNVMPAYSTSASASLVHALFGDASFNYLGIRGGMRFDTSKEAGFTTDEILIRALERLTIGKMATNCVAGLRNSAT